jgi:KaiC/GvpD/RAD55 family RecA-like ATPase
MPNPSINHDISIAKVTPAITQSQDAQQIEFVVTINNKGATNETFSVTLYSNDTAIGEKAIALMAPNSEKNLSFAYSASEFAKENIYVIKAISSDIEGDTTPDNNSYEVSYAKPSKDSSEQTATASLGGAAWIAVAAISAVSPACVFFVWKFRKRDDLNRKLRKGKPPDFQGTNRILDTPLPDAYSIMIVGEADSEKSMFCQQLAHGYLSQGKPILYITYDQFPEEVRANMKKLNWDSSNSEEKGNFVFLDAYSATAGKQSREKYSVKQPFALSELAIVMGTALASFGRDSVKVFLDSTSPLFTRLDPAKVVEFLQDRVAKVKGERAMFFFAVGKGTIQDNFHRRLEEMADCVLELEVQKEKKKVVRKMYLKKFRGQNQPNLEFVIDNNEELTLSILKNPSKKQK